MNAWTNSRSIRRIAFVYIAAGAVSVAAIAGAARGADPAQDDRAVLRFDPLRFSPDAPTSATLVPVTEQEMKTGCVYSHFSARLNRRVWAIREANGQFSHPLGEGTSQPGPVFDIRGTMEERQDKLEQADSDLLKKLSRQGGFVYFTLNHDDRWQLDPTSDHATVYDAETQYRWEWAYGRYIPISSAPFAYRWQVVHGSYVPAEDASSLETRQKCACGASSPDAGRPVY